MTTDKLQILGEGNIALKDTSAHQSTGSVRFNGVLRELHGGSTMTDGEVRLCEGSFGCGTFLCGVETSRGGVSIDSIEDM
jgi:hypothetical protein